MGDATEKPKGASAVTGLQTAGIAAMAAIVGAVVSAWFPYLNRDRELNIRLVEIGIGILRSDPEKSGVSAARQWAIDIIERSSGLAFKPEDRAELLNRPLGFDSSFDYGGFGFSDAPSTADKPAITTPKEQPK